MAEEINKDDIKGFASKPTEFDPEKRSMSWDIIYKANYALIYRLFRDLHKNFKDFVEEEEIKKDPKFKEIETGLNYVWNQFIKHLRTNYRKQYKQLQALKEEEVKELIRKKLKEMSATGAGAGAGHFEPGTGAQYATPYAFNPNKKAKGAKNIYYYKLGWKPVPAEELHKQSKAIDHKDLWKKKLTEEESTTSYVNSLNLQDPSLKKFVTDRVTDFDKIEDKLNRLLPLLKQAKTETLDHYKTSPDFETVYGTDFANEYLDKILILFQNKPE